MNTEMEKLFEKYKEEHKLDLSIFHTDIDFVTALKHAVLSRDENGRKFSHQRRIKNEALENTYKELLCEESELEETKNFEQIYTIIKKHKQPGFGNLCCYDSALRIAEYLGIPINHVYLQAGSFIGAKNLFIIYKKLFKVKEGGYIDKHELPDPFLKKMDEKVIENFLCVMKDEILLIKV